MTNITIIGGNEKESWQYVKAITLAGNGLGIGGFAGPAASLRAGRWGGRAFASPAEAIADPATNAVVILDPPDTRESLIQSALSAGKHVIVNPPFATTADSAARLAALSSSRALLLCCEDRLFYPPFIKAASIVKKKIIGRVNFIRMRSLIAGHGGWDTYLTPDFTALEDEVPIDIAATFRREAYEKLAAAIAVLGPVREIYYNGAADGPAPAVGMLSWKHQAHITYGVVDITIAPDMAIRSAYDPRDDNMEFSGSAGIIWLTRNMSQIRLESTLKVYRGENLFSYGHLDDDWLSGKRDFLRNFADCATKGAAPLYPASFSASVATTATAAFASHGSGRRAV